MSSWVIKRAYIFFRKPTFWRGLFQNGNTIFLVPSLITKVPQNMIKNTLSILTHEDTLNFLCPTYCSNGSGTILWLSKHTNTQMKLIRTQRPQWFYLNIQCITSGTHVPTSGRQLFFFKEQMRFLGWSCWPTNQSLRASVCVCVWCIQSDAKVFIPLEISDIATTNFDVFC